jgi:vitamin B12 transporter
MKKYPTCFALALGVCVITPSVDAANDEDKTEGEQNAVIVTATRTAQTADDSIASVTVITREDIEKSHALSVPELVRGITGLDVTAQGGFGKLSSFFLRGTNSNQTLALVDGLRFGSVTSGTAAWELLPLSEIERIEIVRGPRSSLYGSDAIGGVIQVFTRAGKGPPRGRVELSVGTQQTGSVAGGLSGGSESNWFNVSASAFGTEGIDARQPTTEFGILLDEPDPDGFTNNAFSGRYGHRFQNDSELQLFATQTSGNTEFDSSAGNEDDFTDQAIGATYRIRATSRWNVLLEAGLTTDKRTTFRADGSVADSTFDTEIQNYLWQNDITLGRAHLLTLGVDLRKDEVDSNVDFKTTSRDNWGVFTQYQGNFGRNNVIVGARVDDNEQFGTEPTGNIGWGYNLPKSMRVVASYGTAFRAPTFNDLYFPDFFGFPTSNPDLQPEKSQSTEVGLSGSFRGGGWDVRAYHTEIEDLIALDANFIPQNLNSATINGVEAQISAIVATWLARLQLSYVDPVDDATGNVLPRRSKEWLKLDFERRYGKTNLLFTLIAQGPRYNDLANTVEVSGYAVVNVAVRHQLSKDWAIGGRINNLFNEDYQTVDTFNELGRNVLFTVAYQPQLKR